MFKKYGQKKWGKNHKINAFFQLQLFSSHLPLHPLFHAFIPFPSACAPSAPPHQSGTASGTAGSDDEAPTEPTMEEESDNRSSSRVEMRLLEERIRQMGALLRERAGSDNKGTRSGFLNLQSTAAHYSLDA